MAYILKLEGLFPDQWKSKAAIRGVLQSLNKNEYELDLDLFQEMLGRCETNPKGDVCVDHFMKLVLEADRGLAQRIKARAERITALTKSKDALQFTFNRNEDYNLKRQLQKEINDLATQIEQNEADMHEARENLATIRSAFHSAQAPEAPEPEAESSAESRADLKALVVLTTAVALAELFVSFHKSNNSNLILATFLCALFWLNYFEKYFIRLVMIQTGFALFFDVLWLAFRASSAWGE